MDPQTYRKQIPAGFTEDPWKPKPARDVYRIFLKIEGQGELALIYMTASPIFVPRWWAIWWRPAVANAKWIDYQWQEGGKPEAEEARLMATIPLRGDEGDYFAIGTDHEGNYMTTASNIVQVRGPIES